MVRSATQKAPEPAPGIWPAVTVACTPTAPAVAPEEWLLVVVMPLAPPGTLTVPGALVGSTRPPPPPPPPAIARRARGRGAPRTPPRGGWGLQDSPPGPRKPPLAPPPPPLFSSFAMGLGSVPPPPAVPGAPRAVLPLGYPSAPLL